MSQEVKRITLADSAGNTMALIVAQNGTAFKFYAEARVDGKLSKSNTWIIVNRDRALQFQRGKADDAIADGWREVSRASDDC
jgi:hypothetical protein